MFHSLFLLVLSFTPFAFSQSFQGQLRIQQSGILFLVHSKQSNLHLLSGSQRLELRDDGSSPDHQPNDNIYSAFFATKANNEHQFLLHDRDGQEIWSSRLPNPPADQQTWVTIILKESPNSPQVNFQNIRLGQNSLKSNNWLALWKKMSVPAISAVVGFLVAWFLRRPFRPQLQRLQRANDQPLHSLPGVVGKQQLWAINSDSDEQFLRCLSALCAHSAVVVLTTEDRKIRCSAALQEQENGFLLLAEPPENRAIVRNVKWLMQTGTVVLLIDGFRSLDRTEEHDVNAYAVGLELLAETSLSTVLLVPPEEYSEKLPIDFTFQAEKTT